MIYHFVKHIGIDVEAESLEKARDFVCDIDNVDDELEVLIADSYEDSDSMVDIYDFDVHISNAEYAGYTKNEKNAPEKRLYDYLTDEDDDVCYTITDKGRDYLAHLRGEYPEYNESNYDEHGNRIAYSIADFAKILVSFLSTRARP